eukprot:8865448-Ditylum_brightwellii.AAC.1
MSIPSKKLKMTVIAFAQLPDPHMASQVYSNCLLQHMTSYMPPVAIHHANTDTYQGQHSWKLPSSISAKSTILK